MNRWRSLRQVIGIMLTLLALVGCTPDMTPGQVKGMFVDKATGEPLELAPMLLLLSEGMTEDEIAAFKENETQVETDSSGAFVIENVLPGDYSLMADFVALRFTFSVPPGQTVDLGTIEIER